MEHMKNAFSLLLPVLTITIMTCNLMYEETQNSPCSGIHGKSESGYCHGARNRKPGVYCSEANCHGFSLSGGNTGGPSCYKCHGNKWAVWETHTVSLDRALHHVDILCSVPGTNIQKCGFDGCHGPSLDGGTLYDSGSACTSCHESVPNGCSDGED